MAARYPWYLLADSREGAAKEAALTGRVPPEPLEPPPAKTARRLDRETWRKIAEGRARVTFLMSGEFDELRAACAMSDEDLWQTLTRSPVNLLSATEILT